MWWIIGLAFFGWIIVGGILASLLGNAVRHAIVPLGVVDFGSG